MAEVAARSRAAALSQPGRAAVRRGRGRRTCSPRPTSPTRCAPTTARRSATARRVVILAAGDRARELCARPAWITGFEHRIDSASLGARDLTTAPSATAAGRAAGGDGGVDVAELHAPVHPPGAPAAASAGLGESVAGQPVRRGAVRQPDVRRRAGPDRHGGAARSSPAAPAGPSATPPAARRCSRTWSACMEARPMSRQPGRRARRRARPSTARRRADVSIAGPVPRGHRPGAGRRRARPGRHRRRRGRQGARPVRGRDDARAVPGRRARRHGQAADPGAHRGLGRRRDRRSSRPAWSRPASTAGCWRWRSRSSPSPTPCGRCRIPPPFTMPVGAGAGGYFAPHIRAYIRRSRRARAHRRDGRGQGPAQRRQEPVRAPAAARHHAGEGAGLPDAVGSDPLRRDLPVLRRRRARW